MALNRCEVVAFVATREAHDAREFYERQLGLRLIGDEPYALVFDAHGTTLRVTKVSEFEPAPHTVLGWSVPDIESSVAELGERGVLFERYPGLRQDKRGICTVLGGARVAWFKDPDGNVLSVTEQPRSAAE